MLLQLSIKNFALIEEMTVDFSYGFNIISGETGAGKSILIDAINFVLGGKFNKDIIRTGEEKAYVEAIFSVENEKVNEILHENGVDINEVIIISRESFINGRSITKVNGKSIIISNLKKISERIIDIHGQHENQNLLDKSKHITYLDSFGDDSLYKLIEDYRELRSKSLNIENEIRKLVGVEDKDKLIDYLKYQISDIEEGKLKENEEEELKEKLSVLSNAEKIRLALNSSYSLLKDQMDGKSILDNISHVVQELTSVEKHIYKIKEINESINEAFYLLEENSREIGALLDDVVYDEDELSYINERLYKIAGYKKKYGPSIEEILAYYKKIKKQYDDMINIEEKVKLLEHENNKIIEELHKITDKIRTKRITFAKYLEEKISRELKFLGLEKCSFKIDVEEDKNFNYKGKDIVTFLISTNIGEPLKSLDRIVSGGELSRIMLALKAVFVEKDNIETIIFDEIDTGISGRIAQAVGEKIYEISNRHQVLCITHLPQIACLSDSHYYITKEEKMGKTYSNIKILSKDEKINEIAKMIGGAEITKVTIEHSKEIIKMADALKDKMEIKNE
ncbi:DNA repair protein RecN [Clostridium paridis]|uniref:DNA repair protein RecN n=1 Tax=Clostridium paridis TaxID=2803863 RepID=A0A937FG93_9CLOT|nr:DNA repair protein RecN [Clostridium paridis]MBL4931006.1 DNA repair protein RecN [Clostridium paridis]